MALTAKGVEKLVRDGKSGLTGDGQGLYLKVTDTGAASWVFRYKRHSKSRDMGLGPYPLVGLSAARDFAAQARLLLREGNDPIEVRRAEQSEAKQAELVIETFEEVAREYIASHRAGWKSTKHAQQWGNTLETYAYSTIGNIPPRDITTQHVLNLLKVIWLKKPETANRVRNRIELVLDAAKAKGLRDGENPARWRGHMDKLLPKPSKVQKTKHHSALSWVDLPDFMSTLASLKGASYRAIELTILTALRSSEVLNAQWHEIDLINKVWLIPAARMKAVKDHRLPLSEPVLKLLNDLPRFEGSPFVFPGQKPGKPLSNMTMLMALRRMNRDDITIHGFRSTFRDWAGEDTAHPRDVCEQALAHTIGNAVEAAYRRGDMFEKRRLLMADWASYALSKFQQE